MNDHSGNAISVHPLTGDPTTAWDEISQTQKSIALEIKHPKKSVTPDKIRIVCLSDTHSETENFKFKIPEGDILVHAGDFTRNGTLHEVNKFNEWLALLPHKHKIVISGNHDQYFHWYKDARNLLKNCIYLEDSGITLYGITFYGSPWTPEFCSHAFSLPRGERLLEKWNQIPENVDILITHGPPLGYGDLLGGEIRTGCVELLSTVQKRVRPKYHICGHIHEGYGMFTDGHTVYINAATCNEHYLPKNLPIVFDISLPLEQSKN